MCIYIYHGIWWYINMSRRPSCLLRGQARILVRPRVRQHLAVHVAGVMVRYEAMETIKWLSQLLDFDEVSIYDYSYISNIWLSNDYQMTYMGLSHISNISHMCPIYVPYMSHIFPHVFDPSHAPKKEVDPEKQHTIFIEKEHASQRSCRWP